LVLLDFSQILCSQFYKQWKMKIPWELNYTADPTVSICTHTHTHTHILIYIDRWIDRWTDIDMDADRYRYRLRRIEYLRNFLWGNENNKLEQKIRSWLGSSTLVTKAPQSKLEEENEHEIHSLNHFFFFFVFVFLVLMFEPRVVGRHSTTWVMPPSSPKYLSVYQH
jgi:hypothetical protein